MGPQQLDFSLLASPSMIESEVSLDLTNPQLCTGEVPPNTPNLSNLDEELTKKAKQQEDNLKEHLEKMSGAVRISSDPYPRTLSNPDKEKERRKRQNKGMEALKILVPGLKPKSSEI